MTSNEHLIPVVVKDIAWKAHPNNKISNDNEKFNAEAQIEAIRKYCESALNEYKRLKTKK